MLPVVVYLSHYPLGAIHDFVLTMEMKPEAAVAGESLRYYLPALDSLRFFAFLLVLIHHVSPAPNTQWVQIIRSHGWIGVELFFAISSFLFFYLLKAEAAASGSINIANFYIRRLLRLYPLMVGFPLAMMIIYGLWNAASVGRLLGVVFFTDNFLSWWGYDTQVPFSPHLWTLSYEFQIYLVIPLAFLLYQALGTKRFLLLLGALWLVALGARLAFVLLNVKHPAIWVTPFLRPESTLLGMVIALGVLNRIPGILIAGLAAAGVVVLMLIPNVDAIGPSTLIIYPIAAVICGSALWAAINAKRLAGLVLSRPWLVFLGKISFGLYVFHFYAMWLTALMLKPIPSLYPFNYLSNIAVSLVFSFCLSTASYFLFERFFLRLKMRFSAIENRPI